MRNHHTVFHRGCAVLHSHQQCSRVPISLHACQQLIFSFSSFFYNRHHDGCESGQPILTPAIASLPEVLPHSTSPQLWERALVFCSGDSLIPWQETSAERLGILLLPRGLAINNSTWPAPLCCRDVPSQPGTFSLWWFTLTQPLEFKRHLHREGLPDY